MIKNPRSPSAEDHELPEYAESNHLIVKTVSLAFFFITLCSAILVAFADRQSPIDLAISIAIASAVLLTSIVAENRRAISIASHVLVISLFLLIYGLCFFNNGLQTSPIVAIPFIPALCAKLFRRKICLTYTGLAIAGLPGLLYLSPEGTIRTPGVTEYLTAFWLCVVSLNTTFIALYLVQKNNAMSRSLKYQGERDFLTGLPNRYKIHEHLFRDIAARQSSDEYAAVMMIDVDHFKAYNDRHGHLAGDTALVQVASQLKDIAIKEGGFVGRYGGEEFIFSITSATADDFLNVAETLRQAVAKMHIESSPSRQEHLTVTIGVATNCDKPNSGYETLIYNADQALYKGKTLGRNRVEQFDQIEQSSNEVAHRSTSDRRVKPRRRATEKTSRQKKRAN